MSLDKATVAKIAKLARMKLGEEEAVRLGSELSGIFKWMEQLNAVNTDGVEQMVGVGGVTLPWREDRVTDGNQPDKVLANAPDSAHQCFVVPKVLGES